MPFFSRLAPLDSSISTDMAVGELVEAGGKSRAEEQAWGWQEMKCRQKGGTRPVTDICMTVNKSSDGSHGESLPQDPSGSHHS